MEIFSKMPHFQAVTSDTAERQKIKVMGVLETFSLDIWSPVKFIPKNICLLCEKGH